MLYALLINRYHVFAYDNLLKYAGNYHIFMANPNITCKDIFLMFVVILERYVKKLTGIAH